MLSVKTIKRYIAECEDVLEKGDADAAENLEKDIVYALKGEVPDIKAGLARYKIPIFVSLWDPSSAHRNVNYLGEIKLLRSKLKVMLESYEDEQESDISQDSRNDENPYKIFISYSDSNKKAVVEFVYFLQDLSIPVKNIICTALPYCGVPIGMDIYEYLRRQFTDYNLYVIYMLSNEYYSSPMCLNEMGAAWVLHKEYLSILLPGFDSNAMKGVVSPRELYLKINPRKEDDEFKYRLREIYERMMEMFNLDQLPPEAWERKRDKFYQDFIGAFSS